MPDRRVLVVGTTPDYIAYIHGRYPGRALFLTDPAQRTGAVEAAPDETGEIVCNLLDSGAVRRRLLEHLEHSHQSLSGVTCYDCEWLSLAAELAGQFGLPFPSVKAVQLSRDKFLTKKKWAEKGVRCPGVAMVGSEAEALRLIERFGRSVVLKPTTGAGSELTFLCRDRDELSTAFHAIEDGLAERSHLPLYQRDSSVGAPGLIDRPVLAEEYIDGCEYSADFIIDGEDLNIVRVAKKLAGENLAFGTTIAYVIPAELPEWLSNEGLGDRLREAARALGLTRAICMVDFIICGDEPVFLELTPRIGGDCLPPLIRHSCGLDTIALALDFAEGRTVQIPPTGQWTKHVGLRLFSDHNGVLSGASGDGLSGDARIKEVYFKRLLGHEVTMPPYDYDSWLLGHVIFEPRTDDNLRKQCQEIRRKLTINVERKDDQRLARYRHAGSRAAQSPGPTT